MSIKLSRLIWSVINYTLAFFLLSVPVSAQVTATELTTGASTTDGKSFTTASVLIASTDLLWATFAYSGTVVGDAETAAWAGNAMISANGCSASFTDSGGDQHFICGFYLGSAAGSGTIVFSNATNNRTSASWTVYKFSNWDRVTNVPGTCASSTCGALLQVLYCARANNTGSGASTCGAVTGSQTIGFAAQANANNLIFTSGANSNNNYTGAGGVWTLGTLASTTTPTNKQISQWQAGTSSVADTLTAATTNGANMVGIELAVTAGGSTNCLLGGGIICE